MIFQTHIETQYESVVLIVQLTRSYQYLPFPLMLLVGIYPLKSIFLKFPILIYVQRKVKF